MAGYVSYMVSSFMDSPYTADIKRQFDKLTMDLHDERWKIEESINSWAETLHFQIVEHVKEQKNLLECFHNDRQRILHEKRDEIVKEMHKLNRQRENNEINNLLQRCKTLKFELLVEFSYEDQPLSFIQCVTKEHLEQKKKIESSATKTGNYTSEAMSELKTGRDLKKNIDTHAGSTHDPTSTSSPQTT